MLLTVSKEQVIEAYYKWYRSNDTSDHFVTIIAKQMMRHKMDLCLIQLYVEYYRRNKKHFKDIQ